MKLTTKGRYAVTAMMDLALSSAAGERVTLASIAQHQKISIAYLEQLFTKLKANDLVHGVRGPGGGYRLARPAEMISIYEIINAVDENVDVTLCKGKQNCQEGEICLTHELWTNLSNKIATFLYDIKLGDIVQGHRVRQAQNCESAVACAVEFS